MHQMGYVFALALALTAPAAAQDTLAMEARTCLSLANAVSDRVQDFRDFGPVQDRFFAVSSDQAAAAEAAAQLDTLEREMLIYLTLVVNLCTSTMDRAQGH